MMLYALGYQKYGLNRTTGNIVGMPVGTLLAFLLCCTIAMFHHFSFVCNTVCCGCVYPNQFSFLVIMTGILHFDLGRCFAIEMNIVGSGWPRKERGCECSEQLTDQFSKVQKVRTPITVR
jgi:hypothetical protein